MKTISYINRDAFKDAIPGDFNTYKAMLEFDEEVLKLKKYDKIINEVWNTDKNSETSIWDGLFYASFDIGDRWFVIDENPDKTFTFQENKYEDIIYLIDGCKYQKSFVNKIIKIMNDLNI